MATESDAPQANAGADSDPQFGDATRRALGASPLGGDDETQDRLVQIQREIEASTASCMAREGFEYLPKDFNQTFSLTDPDADTRTYAQEKGFGISTVDFAEQFGDFVDPNAEYVTSLSRSELAEYQTALYGYTDEDLGVLIEESQNGDATFPGVAGCAGAASEQAFSSGGLYDEFDDEFGDEFSNLQERVLADQRVVDAQREFSACLSDAGYFVADADELESVFSDRYSAITDDEESFDRSVPEDLADGESWVQPFTPAAQKLVDELAEEEIAVAVVAWDCGIESREITRQVGIELEQEFLAANGERIDELVND